MHDKWVVYNRDNIKVSIARYKNGKKYVTWKSYNQTGEVISQRKY